ncbi:hypothetical protein GQ54DRAFT_307756 [Martensiomyces pterosporus]|nr:hypothetical protein GQ54DRAFT_307756 [Martensiomyces pterosporus]
MYRVWSLALLLLTALAESARSARLSIDGEGWVEGELSPGQSAIVALRMPKTRADSGSGSSTPAGTPRHNLHLSLSTCSMPGAEGEIGPPRARPLDLGVFLNSSIAEGLWQDGGVFYLAPSVNSPLLRRQQQQQQQQEAQGQPASRNITADDIYYEAESEDRDWYTNGLNRLMYHGWRSDVAYSVVTAPEDEARKGRNYTFVLGFSTVNDTITFESQQAIRVFDTDINSALVRTPYSKAGAPEYTMYVRENMLGYLSRSICGIEKTGTRIVNGTNAMTRKVAVTESILSNTNNGLSPNTDTNANITLHLIDAAQQLSGLHAHILGLRRNTSYEVFLYRRSRLGPGLGTMWMSKLIHTKATNRCRLVYGMKNCPFVAHAVPAPRPLRSRYPAYDRDVTADGEDGHAELDTRNLTALVDVYNAYAISQQQNFEHFLSLNDATSLFYSKMRDCTDCRVAYFSWVCAILAPRCIDKFDRGLQSSDFESIDKDIPGLYNVYHQLMLNTIQRVIGSEYDPDYDVPSEDDLDWTLGLDNPARRGGQHLRRVLEQRDEGAHNDVGADMCPIKRPGIEVEPKLSVSLGSLYRHTDDKHSSSNNNSSNSSSSSSSTTQRIRTSSTGRRRSSSSWHKRKRRRGGGSERKYLASQHLPSSRQRKAAGAVTAGSRARRSAARSIEWNTSQALNYTLESTKSVFPCRGTTCLFPNNNETYVELMPCIGLCQECRRSCPPTLEFECPSTRHTGTFYRSYGLPIQLTDKFMQNLRRMFRRYATKEFETDIYAAAQLRNWSAESTMFAYWLYNNVGKGLPPIQCNPAGSQIQTSLTSDQSTTEADRVGNPGGDWGICIGLCVAYLLIRVLFNIFVP